MSKKNQRPLYLTWLVYRYNIRTTYSCGVPKPWVGDSQQWSSGPAFRVSGVTKFPPCNDWLAHGTAMGFHQHQPASLKNLLSLCTCEPEHPKGRASAQARGNTRVIPRNIATKSVRDKLLALIADWAIGLPPAVETDEALGLFVGQAISRSPLAFLTRHREEHWSDYTTRR